MIKPNANTEVPKRHELHVDTNRVTPVGTYGLYRVGMLMNQRPDGSFTNW